MHDDDPSDAAVIGCDPNIIACDVKTFLTPGLPRILNAA
jgi:hypothetical protein